MSSLGAIAYHVFAGHAPADNPLDLPTLLREGNGLRLSSAVNGVGAWLEELVRAATAPVVRPRDAREFVDYLAEAEKEALPPEQAPPPLADPATAVSGDRLDGGLTVVQRLGRGDSADALLVRRDDSEFVIGSTGMATASVRGRGPRLCTTRTSCGSGTTLATTASDGARRRKDPGPVDRGSDTLSLDLMRRFGENLLAAVEHLEQEGVAHRDIKPNNIGIAKAAGTRRLSPRAVRFLAQPRAYGEYPGRARVLISIPSSPIVNRRLWDLNAERYAAAVTLHQLLDVPRA